jgi:hypothetical protein
LRLKNFLLGMITGLLISACATIYQLPEFVDRRYHFCDDSEVENPVGKLCLSRCIKRATFSDKCKEWETDVRMLSDRLTFLKFRSAGFKCSAK